MILTIKDLELRNRTVFMRLDFNVPLSAPNAEGERSVEEDARITESLPTIRYAIEQGAKVVIASHLGRPDPKNPASLKEFSLEPVATRLAVLLGQEVTLADDCVGEGIELLAKGLKQGQVLMLENLRFHREEESCDSEFSARLARLGQVYITDAFGTAHRKHASTFGVPSLMQERGMGFLIEKELKYLDPLLGEPARPFYAILGGSKVSDKIATIESLMTRVDGLLIGGAMAHAFWAAQGKPIPKAAKQPKPEDIKAATDIYREAKRKEIKILVPADTNEGFDIGTETVRLFNETLARAKTVFWNGPLGWFEKSEYSVGTFEVARALAKVDCIKIVGGGDTVSAIKQSGVAEKFDHLSTGGGAVLEYMEGKGLPGIDVLKYHGRDRKLWQERLAKKRAGITDGATAETPEELEAARAAESAGDEY